MEHSQKLLAHLAALIIIYKKVAEDKKVDINDLPQALVLIQKLPSMINDFKEAGAVIEEFKNLDVAQLVALIQKIDALVKEIEAA